MSLIGDSKEAILFHLQEHEKDYGYSISEELDIQLPAVYEHLNDLEEEGVLESEKIDNRRIYRLTEDGQNLVEILK